MSNLLSLNCLCLNIWGKIQMGVFPNFQTSCQFFINDNCYHSRTRHDIDMKLGPVTKLDKKNKKKKYDDGFMSQMVASLSFSQFMTNLQLPGSQILDAWFKKLIFSLTITFCLIKIEKGTQNSLTQLSHYCLY